MSKRLRPAAEKSSAGATAQFASIICNSDKKWNEIVCGKVSTLFDVAQRSEPLRNREMTRPQIAHRRRKVEVANNPLPPFFNYRRRRPLPGNVEIIESDRVHPILGCEELKRSSYAGIYIENLVLTVTSVVAKINVDEPVVVESSEESNCGFLNHRIRQTNTQAGIATKRRALSQFLAGKCSYTFRPLVEVAIEHPN